MSNGNRLLFIAFAGLALAAGQQPDKGAQTQGGSTQSAQSRPSAETPYQPYAGYNPDPCYNSKDHDAADLCAQWRAALAAEKAAREARRATTWAIVTTVLGIIGTILIAATFLETVRTSRRELRAYVYPEGGSIEIAETTSGRVREGSVLGAVTIKNSGQTPAFDLRHWGAVEIRDMSEEVPTISLQEISKGTTIPPGGFEHKIRSTPRPPTKRQISGIKSGRLGVFVYGRIEYRDAFGSVRFTNYALTFSRSWPPSSQVMLLFHSGGNDSS